MLKIIKEVLEENVGINVGIKGLVLAAIKDNPHIPAREISSNIGFSQRQVERTISQLKAEGKLIRTGSNKSGTWQIR